MNAALDFKSGSMLVTWIIVTSVPLAHWPAAWRYHLHSKAIQHQFLAGGSFTGDLDELDKDSYEMPYCFEILEASSR